MGKTDPGLVFPHQENGFAELCKFCMIISVLALLPFRAEAELTFHPSAELSATWLDNVDLASNGVLKKEEYVYQITPAFTFEQKSPRMDSTLAYKMRNLYYQNDKDRSERYHQLDAGSTVELLSDYFYVDGLADYTQQLVDPGKQTNTDLLFQVNNVSDVATVSISPYLFHEFDGTLADLRYRRGWVNFKDDIVAGSLLEDVDTEIYTAAFGSADPESRLSWQLRYDAQSANYKLSPAFNFESATAEVGLLLMRTLRLIGRGGFESDIGHGKTDGGLDYATWDTGLRWEPSQRTQVQALYGERSFGKTYNVRINHKARLVELTASYVQEPTTLGQELVLRPVTQQQAATQVLLPGMPNFDRITSDVYVRKDVEGGMEINGRRNQFQLSGFKFHRDFLAKELVEEFKGGRAAYTRQLSAALSFLLDGRYSNVKTRDNDAYIERFYRTGLNVQVDKRISIHLTGQQIQRKGDLLSYKANWITLAFKGEY